MVTSNTRSVPKSHMKVHSLLSCRNPGAADMKDIWASGKGLAEYECGIYQLSGLEGLEALVSTSVIYKFTLGNITQRHAFALLKSLVAWVLHEIHNYKGWKQKLRWPSIGLCSWHSGTANNQSISWQYFNWHWGIRKVVEAQRDLTPPDLRAWVSNIQPGYIVIVPYSSLNALLWFRCELARVYFRKL